jgi:4-amino-4-deoxychorismate lyase
LLEKQSHFISVNGQLNGGLSPQDRGLAYGDGVFETLQVVNGFVPLWHYHQERLLKGLKALAIEVPTEMLNLVVQQLLNELTRVCHEQTTGVCKIIVTRGDSQRGYSVVDGSSANVILNYQPNSLKDSSDLCLRLTRCDTAIIESKTLAGIKHLNRLENVLSRKEVTAQGFDDGVLISQRGLVIEAVSSNIFFLMNDQLHTPKIELSGVSGVVRRLVIEELAESSGLTVVECDIEAGNFNHYTSAFICNAITGLVLVGSIDEVGYGKSEHITQLQRQFIQFMQRKPPTSEMVF